MALYKYYYFLNLLLFNYIQYLSAYPCYVCSPIHFNYSVTVDNFPSPTEHDCNIITAETGCFVRVFWNNNKTTEITYGTNLGFPHDSVRVEIGRGVNTLSNLYTTEVQIAFICGSSDSTPCNTVENLKRSFISTTLPTENKIREYDELLIPTQTFNSSLCYEFSNMTDLCPQKDLDDCRKCFIVIEYSQITDICATCPSGEFEWNNFRYNTMFLLQNRTRSDSIFLRCQSGVNCNSINNIEKIQQNLVAQFDFDKFFYSSTSTIIYSTTSTNIYSVTSTIKLSFILLLSSLYIGLFHLF
ncbi:unnamed protein product [Adineta steineri]|uniref:Uncharacterized protein n=1 Tax=Adineta steineri TaxID=433720 RepID=A0A814DLE9_9BILA|nr:unnamed protein product [Adineta steineri]